MQAPEALRPRRRPSSSNPVTWGDGVLECWSTAPIGNCTPRPRGWECFQSEIADATRRPF